MYINIRVLPGALLGVVGGAGVLKGSKSVALNFKGLSVGRGDLGFCKTDLDLARLIKQILYQQGN